jgi:hypothetical protein
MPLAPVLQTMRAPAWRFAAAGWLAAAGGCFSPRYEECRVACTSDEDCAPGQACGAAGVCTAGGEPLECGGEAVPDAPEGSPVGTYNLALTNQENGCDIDGWMTGGTSNLSEKITAMESRLAAEATGSAGMLLMGWLGTHTFTGPLQGARLDLTLMGTKNSSKLGCVYTFDLTLDAVLDGTRLGGSMFYRARTNGVAGCGVLNGCISRQELRGVRSP